MNKHGFWAVAALTLGLLCGLTAYVFDGPWGKWNALFAGLNISNAVWNFQEWRNTR